ncbi:MAG TPA: SDR family NAD(P)-dependent oxidoreductase [Thermoplasmata archaeon]|nr:SDR family NAD(P)-dependent oxidoreductase [Thermoplasmata archaeon]
MRVLVTGGAGFIGRWVVHALLARKDEVVVLDDLSNGSEANLKEFRRTRTFRFVKGDVSDPGSVADAFRPGFDLCVHLAAMIEVQKSIEDPRRTFDVNTAGTANVLEECRQHDAKVIIVSTCMVYDMAGAGQGISEHHPTKPASPYAASKLAADMLALSYHHSYGLPVVIVRPFNTYGPYQKSNQEGGVVAVFLARALAGKSLPVFGEGSQTRDFLYVDDCADLVLRAAADPRAHGEIVNGGTGREITILELARLIAGPAGRIEHKPHPHPQSEIHRLRCDPSKAMALLGWKPTVTLEEGIRRTKEWMSP